MEPAVDILSAEPPIRAVLLWPPGEEEEQHLVQVFVIMKRAGGVLLALPENILDDASLRRQSEPLEDGGEPLVGPYKTFAAPLLISGLDGRLEQSGESCNVLVVDMSLPGVGDCLHPFVEDGTDVDLTNHFINSDPGARPSLPDLLHAVQEWISSELHGDRLAFYSAQEEEDQPQMESPTAAPNHGRPGGSTTPGKAPGVAKAGQKRPTVAALAAQLETVLGTLPALTEQLAVLTEKQNALEKSQRVGAEPAAPFKPMAVGKTAMPVSALLQPGGTPKAAAGLHTLLGPPPPTRGLPQEALTAPHVKFHEDEPLDPLQPEEDWGAQSPMAMALLEQSKALRALMVHFHASGSDPMSDLSSAAPTTGVKGTMAREKLQRELSQGSGLFYLKVCQAIHRRMSPHPGHLQIFQKPKEHHC